MSKSAPIYTRRQLLRRLERGWTRIEGGIDRVARLSVRVKPYNPLYYLGQLAVLLLIILIATGIYLTIFYRPGSDTAYQSVVLLSSNWFGRLMRTAHRFASDWLIVVILLHALKMLISDRFWGSRWFAWVSGWALLALTWSLGVMGYWLVWDEPAQWLTEWALNIVRGPLAYSFLSPDSATATYAVFVIVLFLHVFLPPLIGVGLIIHVMRLARARYWSPRWLVWLTIVALVLVSLLLPVTNRLPVDFGRTVSTPPIDWLYLGFLPTAERLGTPLTWVLTILVVALLTALPWLRRGQHEGPAEVIPTNCTGCGACVRECPYNAIDLLQRDDDSGYASLALVKPNLCTGCGICVGSCPDQAIELDRLPSPVVRQDLQRRLGQLASTGEAPITVYTCDRHHALGTLPQLENEQSAEKPFQIDGTIPILQADLPPRITIGTWRDAAGVQHPVMSAVVPCTGMLHPNWASETLAAGAAGAIVVSCPASDCAHREGPHWIGKRLTRRRTLRKGNTHFLEVAPGSQSTVHTLWSQMVGDAAAQAAARADLSTVGSAKADMPLPSRSERLRKLVPGLALLVVVLGMSLLPTWRVRRVNSAEAGIRLVINHSGQRIADADNLPPEIAAKLPPNVDPAVVLGGERFPVHLRVTVDDALAFERTYAAGGLRKEGTIYATELVVLSPGAHDVVVELMDDGSTWRRVFDQSVEIAERRFEMLYWQESQAAFQRQ